MTTKSMLEHRMGAGQWQEQPPIRFVDYCDRWGRRDYHWYLSGDSGRSSSVQSEGLMLQTGTGAGAYARLNKGYDGTNYSNCFGYSGCVTNFIARATDLGTDAQSHIRVGFVAQQSGGDYACMFAYASTGATYQLDCVGQQCDTGIPRDNDYRLFTIENKGNKANSSLYIDGVLCATHYANNLNTDMNFQMELYNDSGQAKAHIKYVECYNS